MFEKNSNAQLARNFMIALPKELSLEENKKLIEEFVKEHFVSKGMIADLAIHDETKEDNQNIHAHIMPIVRPINLDGTWGQKIKKEYLFNEKANPYLDVTVDIDKVKQAFESAKQNPGEENSFSQLILNQWVKQAVRWMPMDKWNA